jgi:hypothetical protein
MEGPAVMIAVGTVSASKHFTLPVELLSAHSTFFKAEIQRLTSTAASKKRKIAPDSDVATPTTANEENHQDHNAAPYLAISVPDIDPAIFGLFLTYMYTGSYPSAVDDSIFSAWTPNILTSASSPHCPETKPPNAHPNLVPASISAWLLAYRIGAPSFTNHAMLRIYKGLGLYFTLTPNLTEYIWCATTADMPSIAGQTSVEAPAHLAGLDRNPLRKFILDILTTYASTQASNNEHLQY